MDKNIKFQYFVLTQTERAKIKQQTPMCLWMTGLSGAGKSTLANALEQELNKQGKHTYILDQQPLVYNINQILNPDLIAVREKNMKFNAEDKHEA